MKKNYFFAALLGAFFCIAPTSCNNENEELDENPVSEQIVFDNKGEIETDEDVVISTFDVAQKDGLKASTTRFYDFRVLSSGSNDLPDSFYQDGGIYYKLGIDLNNGAGGQWMYLYYRYAYSPELPVTNLVGYASKSSCYQSTIRNFINSSNLKPFAVVKDYGGVTDRDGNLVNCNQGAGGKCVYLLQTRNTYYAPVTGILVRSTTKDYTYTRSIVSDGRTYETVTNWTNISDNSRRNLLGQSLDFNLDTNKHKRNIYIYFTRE